jgi:carboxypeptidase PM20D1
VLLVALIVLRALVYGPGPSAPAPVALAAAPPLDVDAAAAHLGAAVRFQTVSHQDPKADDPAAFDAFRAWLVAAYPKFHALARREVVGGGALIYTWAGKDPTLPPIVLMAHQDVVPVEPQTLGRWVRPAFSGALFDGAVWGRGSVDDKGSLIALMEALEALAASGFQPSRSVIVVCGDHEETTGGAIGEVALRLQKRDVHALFVLDEGLSIVEDNPITGRAAALIGVAEKGYATLSITAQGAGGHASTPPPTTAALAVAQAVTRIAAKPFPLTMRPPVSDMLAALAPDESFAKKLVFANDWLFGPLTAERIASSPTGAAMLHTTIAPTMLEGSPKDNILPERALARINYRILPGDTAAGVMERAKAATKGLPVTLKWDGQPTEPSLPSSSRSGAFRVIAALVADMEHVRAAPALMIAATDSRRMTPAATDIYTFEFTRGTVDELERVHGVNERMTLQNLRRLETFFARLIATTAAG